MPIIENQVTVSLDTILFATDFSPSSETAKHYVEALALRYHSRVRLLHVVDLGAAFNGPDAGLSIDIFRRAGEESLSRLGKELVSRKLSVETVLCEAIHPAAEILQSSQQPMDRPVDLMVVGTRGHKGLARLVLGSTAEVLIHQASCPILTIGPAVAPPQNQISFQTIVYATDFSPEAAKAFVFASSFAQDFGAHLYLCHVLPNHPHAMNDEELNNQFIDALRMLIPDVAREWCEPECVLEHGVAADGILLLAQRVKADLIVLGTRKASHWYDNFKTGVAFQVISGSPCPVLTIRE
jgi:nucleotide-binding universal stress UspA family protein